MQNVMSTSPSESGQIRVSVFVCCVIGFLNVGILIGGFLGGGLMKFSQNYENKEISHRNKNSKSNISRSQNESTFYDEIVLTDKSSAVNLSHNIAYGDVKKN